MGYSVVIPTVGRACLSTLVTALGRGTGPMPDEVVIVNDRPERTLSVAAPTGIDGRIRLIVGRGRGPAAARNVGWRAVRAPWVVFLDDDVVPDDTWCDELVRDLANAGDAAGVQGLVSVPLPSGRRPTDWERQVAGLATATWITADMAYRRDVLADVGGFDERFPRAYREDTELALRVLARGHRLVQGGRQARHPVRPAAPWISVSRQRGNADDALLRRLHGPRWRRLAGAPPGRRPRHAAISVAGVAAVAAAALGRRRIAALAGIAWLVGTAEFAGRRIVAGPRTPAEVTATVLTSLVIPPLATVYWLRGWWAHRGVARLVHPLTVHGGAR